jgi:coiled-coil domain-containing protein 55
MDSTAPAKISFSFKAKAKPSKPTVVPSQPSAFVSLDEEQDAQAPNGSAKPGKSEPRSLVPTQTTMTKAMKKEMEQQKKVDATVYEYDEVYDSLKEAERLAAIAREEEAKIRQVQPHFPYLIVWLSDILSFLF